jgi:hypothetical protein
MTEAEIHALFSALQNGTDAIKSLAHQQLLEACDAVIEPLQQALEDMLWTHLPNSREPESDPPPQTPEQRQRILSMALVLSDFGSPWSLRTLAKVGSRVPFLNVIATLEARAHPDDIRALISTLGWLQGQMGEMLRMIPLAEALVRIARKHPERHSELRAALPLLGGFRTGAPLTFLRLHRQLQHALTKNSLPIPASATQESENLPIPTREDLQ